MRSEREQKKQPITDDELARYYERYSQGHDQRKETLLKALSSVERDSKAPVETSRDIETAWGGRKVRIYYRTAAAVAAGLFVVFGVTSLFNPGHRIDRDGSGKPIVQIDPHAAWAAAIRQTSQIQSVHLKIKTIGSGLEMWWRKPEDFRMVFSNGDIHTNNRSVRCIYNRKANRLTLRDGGSKGMELVFLGELGQMFTTQRYLSEGLLRDSEFVRSELIEYKGESCRKMVYDKGQKRYEYVIDRHEPIIYEAKLYKKSQPEILQYHIEILDINKEVDENIFAVEPAAAMTIEDKRAN